MVVLEKIIDQIIDLSIAKQPRSTSQKTPRVDA